MVASLFVEVPGESPFEVRLDADLVTIGRAESNVLGLRDMNVSRHHFSIERRGEVYIVQDRGSRNGTLVNGVAVLDKVLEEGDQYDVDYALLAITWSQTKMPAPVLRPGPGRHLSDELLLVAHPRGEPTQASAASNPSGAPPQRFAVASQTWPELG